MPQKTIEQVREARTPEWLTIPEVEGIAIGLFKSKPCVKIFASVKAKELRSKIPSSVEGYAVMIEKTGAIHSLEQE